MAGDDFIARELAARREAGLARELRRVDGPQDTWVTVDGRRVLLLCSNNYLGLANHPAVRDAAQRAVADYGVGAGASRLISGSMALHHALEERLAAFKGTEAAVLFNSGYHANIGTIAALVGPGDIVLSDALNHASIIDGCRLSHAQVLVYPHGDSEALRTLLVRHLARRRLIVTESVFSMDGDTAPLAGICDLAEKHGAMVMVDEAHATGVLGPRGAGLVDELGLHERVTVQIGTLGKAFGTFGAFAAARRSVVELLTNAARSFIYTTALPPPVVGAALAAVQVAEAEPQRRRQLMDNAAVLFHRLRQAGWQMGAAPAHIMPVLIGDALTTMRVSARLLEAGVFVQGIRPPTVPPGTARLRVTVMSSHTRADLTFAAEAFAHLAREALRP